MEIKVHQGIFSSFPLILGGRGWQRDREMWSNYPGITVVRRSLKQFEARQRGMAVLRDYFWGTGGEVLPPTGNSGVRGKPCGLRP